MKLNCCSNYYMALVPGLLSKKIRYIALLTPLTRAPLPLFPSSTSALTP